MTDTTTPKLMPATMLDSNTIGVLVVTDAEGAPTITPRELAGALLAVVNQLADQLDTAEADQ